MPDFNVRADAVNVEQIMDQIRARIRDKRGVDYTEDQIRELASVKLEKFLDPRGIRSDLLEQFRKSQPPAAPIELYPFEDTTLFDSHRGIVRFFRRLFRPLLKLVFNSNALAHSLHQQTIINRQTVDRLNAIDRRGDLYYELLHNLVLELTRATIEVKNVSMRVESIASRLEFNERRARALESVVVYKPSDTGPDVRPGPAAVSPTPSSQRGGFVPRENPRPAQSQTPPQRSQMQTPPPPQAAAAAPSASTVPPSAAPAAPGSGEAVVPGEGPGQRSRRRRRRRGRRGGASAAALMTTPGQPASSDVPRDAQAFRPPSPAGALASDARQSEPGGDGSEPSGQTAGSPPPAEPREIAPLQPPSPAEPSAPEPPPSGSHDVDDL